MSFHDAEGETEQEIDEVAKEEMDKESDSFGYNEYGNLLNKNQ